MDDFIKRSDALKVIETANSMVSRLLKSTMKLCMTMDRVAAADVAPVRHGRWIDNKVAFYLGCSECGCYLEYSVDTFLDNGEHYHYCPNCGAKMDKDGDGE